MAKYNDYVIWVRRGGGGYTIFDLENLLEARGHKHALERFLLAFGAPYKTLHVVPVRGGREVTLRSDVAVFRKATQETYRAFFDLEPKQAPYLPTDDVRGKLYARKSAPCEKEKRGAAA